MKWLIIIILIILVLGLYYFTPEAKQLIGMAVQNLAPYKQSLANMLSP